MKFSEIGSVLFMLIISFIAASVSGYPQLYSDNVGEPSDDYEARFKRDHHHPGVTGHVHTFVKTDKHANFKWGVRHNVGHKYAGRK